MQLTIISNNPIRASFRQRIGNYLEILSRNGLICHVVKLPRSELERFKLFRTVQGDDGVLLHKKTLSFPDCRILRRYSKKIIYDFDDAVMYSPGNPEDSSFLRLLPFRRTVKNADLVIAGNSYLAEHAGTYNEHVMVLPTGLETGKYNIHRKMRDEKIRLVWIGSKSTLRYLIDIKPVLEKIGSRFDHVVLRVICDDFFDLRNMQVEKCLWSEKREALDLSAGDIGLAPLPDNPFTRGKCGFKILQYQAAGLPSVASPVGVNADFVKDGVTGFLAKGHSEWIRAIETLIKDTDLRHRLGQAAQSFAMEMDVENIGNQFAGAIIDALKN